MLAFPVGLFRRALATSAWNPSDKSANVTLSNSDTRATSNASGGAVRGALSSSGVSGSRHVEFKVVSGSGYSCGLVTASSPLDGSDYNGGVTGQGLWAFSGGASNDGSTVVAGGAYVVGDVIGIDWNRTTGAFKITKNGATVLSGTNGSGRTYYPVCGRQSFAQAWDLNTGQSAWGSNPDGVAAWG